MLAGQDAADNEQADNFKVARGDNEPRDEERNFIANILKVLRKGCDVEPAEEERI